MARYLVEIPIAGHITVEVEADSEKDAIAAAWESEDLTLDNCENWEALEHFTQGNVCYCPQPWATTATKESE
jgi:nicotinate-nucleotide pyrophosphorylase